MTAVGDHIGPYRIVGPLGSGGMGEVFRAHDTKLGRDVAIKLLPSGLAQDADRRARFEREARLLAALHHQNIATLFAVDDSTGVTAIVMELVDGPTLAECLEHGPLAPKQVLAIARQLAEALDAAHERGIVHRDLKPSNIKVMIDGTVKVLDFGLATAVQTGAEADATRPALSHPGAILGTAAYMSPEQARGLAVDKRTDIWAFGVVLYEMLAGRPPFTGATSSDIMASILQQEPDLAALSVSTPVALRRIVTRCLEKDPRRRMRDIGDVRAELEAPAVPESPARPASPRDHVRAVSAAWAAVGFSLLLLLGVGVYLLVRRGPTAGAAAARQPLHLTIALTAADLDSSAPQPAIALSPDGSLLAYVAAQPKRIVVQSLLTGQTRTLPGTEGVRDPFFSPDGRWLGFFAARKLQKIAIDGGPPQILADAPNPRGGTWQQDGSIVFAPLNNSPLFEVSSAGGPPRALTALDGNAGEFSHRWPHAVQGGLVFAVSTSIAAWDDARLVAFSRATRTQHTLIRGGTFPKEAGGYLIYGSRGSLSAVKFDSERLQIAGTPAPVLDNVWDDVTNGGFSYAISASGAMAFVPGGVVGRNRTLVWVDRKGDAAPLGAPLRPYEHMAVSPDGNRVAVAASEASQELWVYDVVRKNLSRLSVGGSQNYPVWAPDGSKLAFYAIRPGLEGILWRPADGSGVEQPLVTGQGIRVPDSFTADGSALVFSEQQPKTGWDLWRMPVRGEGKPVPVLQTPFDEEAGMVSPDGRWLAYVSNETGRTEIYVRSFPDAGVKQQVSTEGGREPVWSRNGRELFYRQGTRMMHATVSAGAAVSTLSTGRPESLFDGPFQVRPGSSHASFDVSADSQRFLMIQNEAHEPTTSRVNLTLDWLDELRQRVP